MMGREDPPQPSLFYTSFNLDKRIRPNHPLRKVAKVIDFGFVSDEVEHLYGTNGNVSVPPPVILKLLVLLMLYNVRSERIVYQCVEAGLVEGKKLFMDSSMVDADASRESIVDTHSLKRYFNRAYRQLEKRLESLEDEDDDPSDGSR